MLPFAPVPDPGGRRFIEEEASIRAIIENHGRSPKVVRNSIEFLAYRDSAKFLAAALETLGLPDYALEQVITKSLTADGRAPGMHDLLVAMPIQGVFTELRIQAHLKKQWNLRPSDLLDFVTMATVLPFVDYFVADKRTYNLASSAGFNKRGGGRVVRRLRDLCDNLRHRRTLAAEQTNPG